MTDTIKHIAIIGAGIAGLSCATVLKQADLRVSIFDKSKGPAGRMSTRRGESWECDHGAQYFTATSEPFRYQVRSWLDSGVAREWTGRVGALSNGRTRPSTGQTTRYVGAPEMAAIASR